jgi:AAHS family 3-hydroxyphenylpropionic acid transporter
MTNRHVVNTRLFVISVLLGLFDGADLGSMGLAMSRISRELSLDPVEAGLCASASLVGLTLGAMVCGRLADIIGRKILLAATALCLGVFSLLTAHVVTYHALLVVRFLAGIGMGGLYPIVIMSCHDSAVPSFRSTAVSILVAAASVGGLSVSMVAMAPDWRWIFYFGGIGPLLLLPFILMIPSTDAVARTGNSDRNRIGAILFGEARTMGTVAVWASCFFTAMTIYCVINWVAALLVKQGYTENMSHVGAATYSVGAIFGNLLAGYLADRGGARTVYITTYLTTVGGLLLMAATPGPALTFLSIFGIAAAIGGAQLVTYALVPTFYPALGRGTGVGAMVASGRIGSICGPIMAGLVLRGGGSAGAVFLALVPGVLVALVLALAFLKQLRLRAIP